jgi:hypothetical protein
LFQDISRQTDGLLVVTSRTAVLDFDLVDHPSSSLYGMPDLSMVFVASPCASPPAAQL